MMPIALLMIEHRQIERVVPLLREEARRARAGEVDLKRVDAIIDFIKIYADKCHHGKEEDILFTAMSGKPLTSDLKSAMERLIEDHKASRAYVMSAVDATMNIRSGEMGALVAMASALERLADLYPAHIASEDQAFFIPSMALFSKDEQSRMLVQFQIFDRSLIQQIYRDRMDELAGKPAGREPMTKASEVPGGKWICTVCDFLYDPAKGAPEHGIAPGTSFEDIPDDWVCPVCGASKGAFEKREPR